MLYIFAENGEVLGACDGPEIDMKAAFDEWYAANVDCGPRPRMQSELRDWFERLDTTLKALHQKYGSLYQFGHKALWLKVLVKERGYVARPFVSPELSE